MILDYVLKFHVQECLDILTEADLLGYYTLKIDFMNLFETHPDIGDKVLCSPIETLPLCNKDVIKAQQYIIENEEYRKLVAKLNYCGVKNNVHARFFGLPVCPELHRTIFPKNADMGCFLKVTGTIVRVTQSKMLEYQRKYVCTKCKHETLVEAQFEQRYVLKAPTKCGNEDKKCKSVTFSQVNLVSREHCKDYQEIKIQEQVNKLSIGTIPGSMWVVLEDDLVDSCKPGDDINICGIVRRRWRPSTQDKKSEVDLVLQANFLEVCNAQRSKVVAMAPDVKDCFNEYWTKFEACPVKGRDGILASVAPQVFGLYLVKLALLLTVITSSNHIVESETDKKSSDEDKEESRVRGQCHLLLVGDPGTGKSQLLGAGAALSARGLRASGAGSSKAGLTCAALREEGEWQLEAGALVLADGGVCSVDELGALRAADRAAAHEAMEQQTVSVAKAGIVCKLNTRCAVVAACNPKGHYDTDQPLSANVSLGTPLLSRFDLIFILLDTKNKAWDKLVSSFLLFGDSSAQTKNKWSLEKLQMYISLVGPRRTQLSPAADAVLQAYYLRRRRAASRDAAATTVRMLDSLVRLSQAHCRLMYRTTILPMDAIVAVSLMDESARVPGTSDDALHSTFPNHPDFQYLCTAKRWLTELSLDKIWKDELLAYAKILKTDHKTLEHQIDIQNSQIFAKYDDVSDDNIPLSSKLITSSYFKDNKKEKSESAKTVEEKKIETKTVKKVVNEKLVATLKKHASLNKETKEPPNNVKKTKRKRKELVINTDGFIQTKKSKRKKESDDLDIEEDVTSILKAIPSVNNVFDDLDLDLNFDSEHYKDPNVNEDNKSCNIKVENDSFVDENQQKENHTEINKDKSSTSSKLKQFQFKEKRDLSKFLDKGSIKLNKIEVKVEKSINNETVQEPQASIFERSICDISFDDKPTDNHKRIEPGKCGDEHYKNTVTDIENKKSVSSSQISIFESSDCDIDLDL